LWESPKDVCVAASLPATVVMHGSSKLENGTKFYRPPEVRLDNDSNTTNIFNTILIST